MSSNPWPRNDVFLMPLLDHCSAEKQGGKRDLIWPIGPGRMVFTLLAEIIAI